MEKTTHAEASRLHNLLDDRLDGYLRTDAASRALWSTDASIYLRKPVGVVVDSGCCAMAGLFGYQKGHYDVSIKMGERRLFPAVREAEERVVVAPGTSCREQILDGTARRALHPAEYLAQLIEE